MDERALLRCIWCGAAGSPCLYITPICPACARECRLEIALTATRRAIILRSPHGERILEWTTRGPGSAAYLVRAAAQRQARLADIAREAATLDDPAFVAEIGLYEAQVGPDDFVSGVRARQAAQATWLAAAEAVLRTA